MMLKKTKVIFLASMLCLSSNSFGSPFTTAVGKTHIGVSLSSGKADKIILEDADNTVAKSLTYLGLTTKASYGLKEKLDAGLGLNLRSTKGGGDFSGLADIALFSKYAYHSGTVVFNAIELHLKIPGDYKANTIAAPGKGEPSVAVKHSTAYYNPQTMPLYLGFEIDAEAYAGEVPPQVKALFNVYYMSGMMSYGLFVGALNTIGGKKLNTGTEPVADDETTEYSKVQEEYITYGLAIGYQMNPSSNLSFATSVKPESGMKNSDPNTNFVLNYGYTM